MKTVYLVRHGESTENVRTDPMFAGPDAQLTELGREQAQSIASRAANLTFDALISSTMLRARDTAAAIAEVAHKNIETSDLFVERMSPSSYVGGSWADEEFVRKFRAWEETMISDDDAIEDGENFASIRTRAEQALQYLAARPEPNMLVVTHGFFLRVLVGLVVLQDAFIAPDMKRMYTTMVTRNTGITVVFFDETKNTWQLLTWNDHAHLG